MLEALLVGALVGVLAAASVVAVEEWGPLEQLVASDRRSHTPSGISQCRSLSGMSCDISADKLAGKSQGLLMMAAGQR